MEFIFYVFSLILTVDLGLYFVGPLAMNVWEVCSLPTINDIILLLLDFLDVVI